MIDLIRLYIMIDEEVMFCCRVWLHDASVLWSWTRICYAHRGQFQAGLHLAADTSQPSLGPFHGAIAVPSVTRCRCRRRRRLVVVVDIDAQAVCDSGGSSDPW